MICQMGEMGASRFTRDWDFDQLSRQSRFAVCGTDDSKRTLRIGYYEGLGESALMTSVRPCGNSLPQGLSDIM
jgi:hypothetical protein